MLEGALSDRVRSEMMKVGFDESDDARVENPVVASVLETVALVLVVQTLMCSSCCIKMVRIGRGMCVGLEVSTETAGTTEYTQKV